MSARGFTCCDAGASLQAVHDLATYLIPGTLASAETIALVQRCTQSSVFGFQERGRLTGFITFFTLSAAGERALASGAFCGIDIDLEWLAPPGPDTRTGYIWAFGGSTPIARMACLRTWRALREQVFASLSVYARAATEEGRKLLEPFGYTEVGETGLFHAPPFALPATGARRRRAAPPKPVAFARAKTASNNVCVNIVRDLNALQRVITLRALVYMGEQACPYEEEFDGNDLAASTHLLAEVDGEPVGTLRLRWFVDFVKFERAAVKRDRRGGAVIRALLGEAIDIARRRGYRRALAHMQPRLAPLWRTFGFEPRAGRPPFAFSDHDYIEGEARLAPHAAALSIDSSPYMLIRPEGEWDRPGVLDFSAARQQAPRR